MSKYMVVVLLGIILTAVVASAIVPVSIRMRGMGEGLVGIVDDEYSDLFFNPAAINRITGTRVYTNLSNLHNFGSDLIFDPEYWPDMYYNLLGGITTCKHHKIGALLETGGYDMTMTSEDFMNQSIGIERVSDTNKYMMRYKNMNTELDIFWGKKIDKYYLGAMFGPKLMDGVMEIKNTSIEYFYSHDSLLSYTFDETDSVSKARVMAYPFILGVISGTHENENSLSFAFGYDRQNGIIPTNFVNSIITNSISTTPWTSDTAFEKMQEKICQGGFFASLTGRNKRRYEGYSLSFLAGITYIHEPISLDAYDTSYSFYTPGTGQKEVTSMIARQKGSGAMNYFGIGVGIGAEKYFNTMGMNSLFAIGLIPSYVNGTNKINIKPAIYKTNYYHNYPHEGMPDTLGYTDVQVLGEYDEIKDCFGGLSLSLPVGLETHLTDRLVLRLGASEDMMLTFKYNTDEMMIDSGTTETYTQTEPFDTTIITHNPPDEIDQYHWKSEEKLNFVSQTTYHYGLGYKINDNIELNFLNYGQLTDLRNWVLGVNIKF